MSEPEPVSDSGASVGPGAEEAAGVGAPSPSSPTSPSPSSRASPSSPPSPSPSPAAAALPLAHAPSIRGWRSRPAALVAALLAVESITGLWIWLAPFSPAGQAQVLLHTLAGLILLVPYALYQWSHFLTWWRQKVTAEMVLGYLLALAVIPCLASGVVLAWQGVAGPKISRLWDLVHLISGVATLALLVVHPLLAFTRRRAAYRSSEPFRRAVRSFARRGGVLAAASLLLVAGLALAWPRRRVEIPIPEGYTLPAYAQEYDEYRGNPFAPTYARTESGRMVDPALLSGSESCGSSGCHEEILREWLPSAHRFSAMNPPFREVQRNFAADREPAETRYCAGCHDPISLFAGAKDIQNQDLAAPGMQEGCSCVVCHSISHVDQRGNADYVLTPPRKYLWEGTEGWRKLVSDFLIRAYPRQHLADYDRNLLRTPEFCGACHKQFIPEALNRFGLSPGQNQYDEWKRSHWHADEPLEDLTCRDCHMRLVRGSHDPGRGEAGDVRRSVDDGAHRHHGTIATNFFIPRVMKLPGWQEHVRLTEEWIRGETEIPEIAHLWPSGPVAALQVTGPKEARPGQEVKLRVLTGNRKAGHNFITGPLDFVRAWVHLRVRDAGGKTLAEWGVIDPATRRITDESGREHRIGNRRKEGTLVLEGQPLDAEGQPLSRHELWRKAGGKGQRVIFPGYSDNQVYRFTVPEGTRGPLSITADLDFRRYRQEFLDLVVPHLEEESGVRQPTVTQTSAELEIPVVEKTSAVAPAPTSATAGTPPAAGARANG